MPNDLLEKVRMVFQENNQTKSIISAMEKALASVEEEREKMIGDYKSMYSEDLSFVRDGFLISSQKNTDESAYLSYLK